MGLVGMWHKAPTVAQTDGLDYSGSFASNIVIVIVHEDDVVLSPGNAGGLATDYNDFCLGIPYRLRSFLVNITDYNPVSRVFF